MILIFGASIFIKPFLAIFNLLLLFCITISFLPIEANGNAIMRDMNKFVNYRTNDKAHKVVEVENSRKKEMSTNFNLIYKDSRKLKDIESDSYPGPVKVFGNDSCVIGEDCNKDHTISVNGTKGNCSCTCRFGWASFSRCNTRNVLYTPSYAVEYDVGCENKTILQADAVTKCSTSMVGLGWTLASVPSKETNALIANLITEDAWLDAFRYYNFTRSLSLFTWQHGRQANTDFWSESGGNLSYCNFVPGHPKYDYCHKILNFYLVIKNDSKQWLDITSIDDSPCNPTYCYVCERSPCNISADCVAKGTIKATGYFPNCKCICKEGFIGTNCGIISVQNNDYISEFTVFCNNNGPVIYTDASARCKTVGSDWFLATVNSANATDAIKMFGNDTAWLGGSSNSTSGAWTWLRGRLKGKVFYKHGEPLYNNYTNWATGRPQDETCGTEKREFLTFGNNGTWVDSYAVNVTCPGTPAMPECFACERQPCSISLDCNANGTANVTGYYPDCHCSCKENWGGVSCELSTFIDNGGYISQYKIYCGSEILNYWPEIPGKCQTLGSGWVIASLPTKGAQDLVTNLTSELFWIGATYDTAVNFPGYTGNQWYWGSEVRAKKHFATSLSCLNESFCYFTPGKSLDQRCQFNQKDKIAVGPKDGDSPRYWSLTTIYGGCIHHIKCVACERTLCVFELDCNKTLSDSIFFGYYPNCVCNCKYPFRGPGCNISSIVNVTNYTSSYDVFCQSSSISYFDAMRKCSEIGFGWALATVPNLAAHILLSDMSRNEDVWLAATDAEVTGQWKWQTGRLNGTIFYSNSICVRHAFCKWDQNQPVHGSQYCQGSGDTVYEDYLALSLGSGVRFWQTKYENTSCQKSLPKCYACERSRCVYKLDCNVSHSSNVSGYYPECQCDCTKGFGGPRCDDLLCTNEADCHGRAANVTGVYPNCTCIGCPRGYRSPDCSPRNDTLTRTISKHTPSSTTSALYTTTVNPNHTCPFLVTSCVKDKINGVTVLCPMYELNISLNGLISAPTDGIAFVLPMPYVVTIYNFTFNLTIVNASNNKVKELSVKETKVHGNAIIALLVAIEAHYASSPTFYIQLASSGKLIEKCCSGSLTFFGDSHSYFKASSVNDTFRIGNLTLLPQVPLPVSGKPSTYSDDNARKAEKELMQQASSGSESTGKDYTELFGPHTDHVVLRALSPFAFMITVNDDGYSGIIISNLIVIIAVAAIHLCVVFALKFCYKCTIREACAAVSFPSMPIYVIYALLPGTAVAAGELVAKVSGIGFLGLIILLIVIIASGLVPYLWLSRALYEIPLLPGCTRSRVELLFPTTVIEPKEIRTMYGAMIGSLNVYMSLWPTIPVWSPVLLFIGAVIQPQSLAWCEALYVLLGILHCLMILLILIFRPFLSMSLNVMYVLGLLPTVLLSFTLAATADTESYVTGTAPRLFLILFTVVNAARLAIAIASPIELFQIVPYLSISHEQPRAIFDSFFNRFNDKSDISVFNIPDTVNCNLVDSLLLKPENSNISAYSASDTEYERESKPNANADI